MVDPGSQAGSSQSCSVPCPAQANSPASTVQTSYPSSPNRFDRNGRRLSSEFEDVDSGRDPRASSLAQPIFGSTSHSTSSILAHEVAGKLCYKLAMNSCLTFTNIVELYYIKN